MRKQGCGGPFIILTDWHSSDILSRSGLHSNVWFIAARRGRSDSVGTRQCAVGLLIDQFGVRTMQIDECVVERRLEARARRAAKRRGLAATKSRGRLHFNNHGRFQLVDPYFNTVVAGVDYDMTADQVIDFCSD
jgi:hypothetical protein